jgi:hypothetical protein
MAGSRRQWTILYTVFFMQLTFIGVNHPPGALFQSGKEIADISFYSPERVFSISLYKFPAGNFFV